MTDNVTPVRALATITIDGQAVPFETGESVIAAARRQGIAIPHYCWHHRLSVAANCRMCLVEVEKAPKLLPACQTECKEGMVVKLNNEKVAKAQSSVHELLLINHPIDCPICDQAGECKLQDYYMRYQHVPSRMRDKKVKKPKLQQLGPYVVYNAERCILCTRCVRFMDEVAQNRQLGVFNRGDHAQIGTAPGQQLDDPYSLNTVDVCPVGALTSKVFRFKQRAWNLKRSHGLCGGCARGCNIYVDHRAGQAYRFLPRENQEVNASWLCDEGRLTFDRANQQRLRQFFIKQPLSDNGSSSSKNQVVDKSRALQYITQKLQTQMVLQQQKTAAPVAPTSSKTAEGSQLLFALSLHTTSEEAYTLARFARSCFGVNRIGIFGYANGSEDKILRLADKNPNRLGILEVLKALDMEVLSEAQCFSILQQQTLQTLVTLGHESSQEEAWLKALSPQIFWLHLTATQTLWQQRVDAVLPVPVWLEKEGSWVNALGRIQKLTAAFASAEEVRPSIYWLNELSSQLGRPLGLLSTAAVQWQLMEHVPLFSNIKLQHLPTEGVAVTLPTVAGAA